jgi:hypothetical protein
MWNEFIVLKEAKKFPICPGFQTPKSTNDCIRQPSSIKYSIFGWNMFWSFFFKFVPYYILVLVACNWGAQVVQCNNFLFFFGCERGFGYDFSLLIYIAMEATIWETYFFGEFKTKDGIWRSKYWEQQFGSREVVKRVLYMYSNHTTSFSICNKLIFGCLSVCIPFSTSAQSFLFRCQK